MAFRLYGLVGCSHCAEAEKFLSENKAPYQAINAANDPIVLLGVKAVTGEQTFPVLFSAVTNEVIRGFNKEAYERVVKVFDSMYRPSASSESAPEGDASKPAEVVAIPEEPPVEGAV